MLSGVSKLAEKPFVIGFLLPAMIFTVVALNLFKPDSLSGLLDQLHTGNPLADLTFLAVGVWILSMVLLLFTTDIYQVLEGYLPPMSWFRWCVSYHQSRFKRLHDRIKALEDGQRDADADELRIKCLAEYPSKSGWILPTAFGNMLRSFETYSYDVYHADGVALWPRLATVVPKDFAAQVESARSQVDALVNFCALGWVMAALAVSDVVVQGWQTRYHPWPASTQSLLLVAALSLVASWLFYRWAVHALGGWGEAVKSAFDCYLPALAQQLGYQLPPDEKARREFWENMNIRLAYRTEFLKGFKPIPVPPKSTVAAAPSEPSSEASGRSADDADDQE
jgi:hypothetical protein